MMETMLQPTYFEEEKSSFEGFHIRLKTLRRSKNITINEIAEKTLVAPTTYQGYEFNKRFPSLEKLHRIARTLETSSDYLLGLTNNPEPKDPPEDLIEWLNEKQCLKINGVDITNNEIRDQLKKSFEMIFHYYQKDKNEN